jgi:hypothetical protein
MVDRDAFKAKPSDEAKIEFLYQTVFQRAPSADERALALDYLHEQSSPGESPSTAGPGATGTASAWKYGTGDYDPATKSVKGFKPLPVFFGNAWQLTGKVQNIRTGGPALTAEGGQVNDPKVDVVRRWTAPADGFISIDATLSHAGKRGDGIRGTVLSSRSGELGSWKVFNTSQPTRFAKIEVRKGDTIDFIADSLEDPTYDTFTWAPVIRLVDAKGTEWNATTQFAGPSGATGSAKLAKAVKQKPLTAWEKFAQVLLESNEAIFVN